MVEVDFSGVVRLNAAGEVVCFCYDADVVSGDCACLNRFPCYQANVRVELLNKLDTPERELEKAVVGAAADAQRAAKKIKAGLSDLEQSIKKSRFKL